MTWPLAALVLGVAGTRRARCAGCRRRRWSRRSSPSRVVVGVVPSAAFGDAAGRAGGAARRSCSWPCRWPSCSTSVGFFAAVAALVDGGRHLRLGLWVLAAAVTVLFNLDAAVVLLTPLYVRIAAATATTRWRWRSSRP